MMRVVVLSLALVLLATPSASSADASVAAGPQAGSDQVRAARTTAPEDALVFTLHEETREGATVSDAATSSVALTPTTTQVTRGGAHTLDDYVLCRTFLWTDGQPQLGGVSCYAAPMFKALELQNRRALQALLAKAEIREAALFSDGYWPEAELGFAPGGRAPLAVRKVGDVTEYRLGDRVVVRLVGSAGELAPGERGAFVRFLARHASLHPQVRRDLGGGTTLPARIEFETALASKVRLHVLTVSGVQRAQMAYPLPAGLTASLRVSPPGDAQQVRGEARVLQVIDGRAPAPSFASILQRISDASAYGRSLEVVLAVDNLALQYPDRLKGVEGSSTVARIKPAYTAALADPDTAAFVRAGDIAGSAQAPGDRQAAALYLAKATFMDALPFGAFRSATFANLLRNSPGAAKWDPAIFAALPRSPTTALWRAIGDYPWTASFYKDLGDTYLAAYDTPDAWLAYDLGRAADPGWAAGPMSALAAGEGRIRSDQPDMF